MRIYFGVHYPLDMIGATGVALCEGRVFDTLFGAGVRLYWFAFAPLIRPGCANR